MVKEGRRQIGRDENHGLNDSARDHNWSNPLISELLPHSQPNLGGHSRASRESGIMKAFVQVPPSTRLVAVNLIRVSCHAVVRGR
jgi:hypothetical protein